MAHFAKLDKNNIVLEVIVVNNNVLDLKNEEKSGIAFLTEWSNGHTNWKQTSYNSNFRKQYASIGDIYDEEKDAFISPQPYPSWTLNEETWSWVCPKEQPGLRWTWNEKNQKWDPPVD